MALETRLGLTVRAVQTGTGDLLAPSAPLWYGKTFTFTNGTAANQADRLFSDTRTLAASANEDLDLAGTTLLDAFGAALTFVRLRGIIVAAAAGNTNNVVIGGAATNGFTSWVGASTHTVTVRPGGVFSLVGPDTSGYTVTAATGDLLRVANSGAGTPVTYDIILIGASA